MAGKILVVGATGQIGTPLVHELVAKGETVKAASRTGKPVGGAESLVFGLGDTADYPAAFDGVDRLFVLVPTGTMDPVGVVGPLLAFAAARKVKVVLMTALGVDASDEIPYRKLELALEASGTPFVILRPNWFADNFHSYWIAGVRQGAIAVPAAEGKSSFIDARDIAASAAAALTSDAFDNRAFNLTGPEALSYADAAAILSDVLGRRIAYTPVDDKTFVGILVGAGVPEGYASFLASIFHPVREGWTAGVTSDVETLTGRRPRSLATYAADRVDLLKA
jgi:uncharacterized protein YbjT (DUF2867 family)